MSFNYQTHSPLLIQPDPEITQSWKESNRYARSRWVPSMFIMLSAFNNQPESHQKLYEILCEWVYIEWNVFKAANKTILQIPFRIFLLSIPYKWHSFRILMKKIGFYISPLNSVEVVISQAHYYHNKWASNEGGWGRLNVVHKIRIGVTKTKIRVVDRWRLLIFHLR